MSHYGSYHAATETALEAELQMIRLCSYVLNKQLTRVMLAAIGFFSSFESPAISSLDAVIPTLGTPYYMVGVAMGGESSYQSSPETLCGYYGNGLFNVYPLYTPLPNGPEYILGDPPRYIAHWKVGTCTLTNKWSGITYSLPVGVHAECPPATYLPEIPYVLLLGKNGMCERMIPASLKIALSEPLTTEPGQTSAFTATVTRDDGASITKAVSVKVSLKVDPQSGGHDHGDYTRPRGSIAGTKCTSDDTCKTLTTDNNGVLSFNFTAEEAAGTHTITVSCDKCSNSDSKDVNVKVDGLEPMPLSILYTFIGQTNQHSDNHYLKPEALNKLWRIALAYQYEQQFKLQDPITGQFTVIPPPLHVNDASLKWGGLFDISGKWVSPHSEHRRGTVIDVRANALPTAIPEGSFEDFIFLSLQYGVDAFLEEPDVDHRHFHLRLMNRKE